MSTEIKMTGVAANLASETAQETVTTVGRNGSLQQPPVGSPEAQRLTQTKAAGFIAKAREIGRKPVELQHVAAVGAVGVAVVGYEFVAAKKDWPRMGIFGKKTGKR